MSAQIVYALVLWCGVCAIAIASSWALCAIHTRVLDWFDRQRVRAIRRAIDQAAIEHLIHETRQPSRVFG